MKKWLGILLVAALCAALLCVGAGAADNDTIYISTAGELAAFRNDVNSGNSYEGKTVVLTADIDLGGVASPWTPIGGPGISHPFSGTFDGGGHTISGLYIDSSSNSQGLFGYAYKGTVKNLSVSGSVTGYESVGGVVGYNDGGAVENCSFSGTVTGAGNVGGVVGNSSGAGSAGAQDGVNGNKVINCRNTGTVTCTNSASNYPNVGGVVGFTNSNSNITNCSNTGEVKYDGTNTDGKVGGVVGSNGGTVSSCYNTGSVTATGAGDVGGVVGYNSCNHSGLKDLNGTVINCYNTGEVSGAGNVGGVVGYNHSRFSNPVSDTSSGGLIRFSLKGIVSNCYNIGSVTGTGNVGGVVGYNNFATNQDDESKTVSGEVINCYYLASSDNLLGIGYDGSGSESDGTTGLNDDTFDNENSFSGWEFTNTWTMDAGLGRPVLVDCRETFEVTGYGLSESTAFQIPNLDTLEYFRNLINADATYLVAGEEHSYSAAYYKLTNNIDMSEKYGKDKESWEPIGTDEDYTYDANADNAFTGTFDGGGHTISGLYVSKTVERLGPDAPAIVIGLFGHVKGGTVQNLKVEGGDIDVIYNATYGAYVGGIAGCLEGGTIYNCSFTGDIDYSGDEVCYIGGIAGWLNSSGTIENCQHNGNIIGSECIGGIVGYLYGGEVTGCCNCGGVTGSGDNSDVGGVVGDNYGGAITGCYNTGNVTANGEGTNAGGVVGQNDGGAAVSGCYNEGNVTANGESSNAGGVVGSHTNGSVSSCYNTGAVSGAGKSYAGGVVGSHVKGSVSSCYNTGEITGTDAISGGVIGESSGSVENCYYLEGTANSGIGGSTSDTEGCTERKTTAEFASGEVAWLLQSAQTVGEGGEAQQVWGQDIDGDSLPVLTSEPGKKVIQLTWQYQMPGEEGTRPIETEYRNTDYYEKSQSLWTCSFNLPATFESIPEGMGVKYWVGKTKQTVISNITPGSACFSASDITLTAVLVEDTVPVESVILSEMELTLDVGGTHTLTATVTPEGAGRLTWSSSDAGVAEVENGVVTAVGPGTATITATAGGVSAECTVTVRSIGGGGVPDPTYKPVIDAPEGVEVTTDPARPKPGDEVTVKTEPEGDVSVTDRDGNDVDVTRNPDGTWSYIQPEGAVKITYTPHSGFPFVDVPEGSWYRGAVEYVYFNGLMDGVSDTRFSPDGTMTRAMAWAILARVDGETVTGADWAETARAWAISSGVSDGENPNAYVTREQLATMLWRCAGEPNSSCSLSAFTDADAISGWAVTAMRWAAELGIITGVTDTTLVPQGTATRAQCAAMLMRCRAL